MPKSNISQKKSDGVESELKSDDELCSLAVSEEMLDRDSDEMLISDDENELSDDQGLEDSVARGRDDWL